MTTVDALLQFYFRLGEHRGKYRISQWLGRHFVPSEGVLARVFPDVDLYLHPRDWIEYTLLCQGHYEPLTLRFLLENLTLGQSAVLAGVNFGLHVAVAARAVGDSGNIIGVEPQPAALLRAHANLARNGLLKPVHLLSGALGAQAGFQSMAWSSPTNTGAASLLDTGSGLTIQMATLDSVIRNSLNTPPRLLLLDVQGYELEALLGLSQEFAPDIIVTELDPEFLSRAKVTASELCSRLTDLGYLLKTLHGGEVRGVELDLPERNLVGVKDGVAVKWVSADKAHQ